MKNWIISCVFILCSFWGSAQSFTPGAEAGVFLGTSYYIGDLNEEHFDLAQPALGLIYRWNLNRRFTIKGSVWAGEIRGHDKRSNDSIQIDRNLHFKSPITEISAQLEFNFFEYETGSKRHRFTPFVFTGVSFMMFNPQARRWNTDTPFDNDGVGTNNPWVELQPLGTEGQGSLSHPEKGDLYPLSQVVVPLGLGLKLSLGEKFSLIAEFGIRKTFTDYLDDVGGTYANPDELYEESAVAAQLSDRSIPFYEWAVSQIGYDATDAEIGALIQMWEGNYDSSINAGNLRSNPNEWNDWYVFSGITLSYKIVRKPKVCLF